MDVAERLATLPIAGLPLLRPVVVHWSAQHVPFIEADTDHDLAVTLGTLHVHLRWAQMEIMRYLAQGRVAELVGPLGLRLDRLLRTLDLTRAVPQIVTSLPEATCDWLNAFVLGVNHAVQRLPRVPPEFRLLGLGRRQWTLHDIVTIGRLAAFDVTWIAWSRLSKSRGRLPLDEAWRRLTRADATDPERRQPEEVLQGFARPGSNAWAIAPTRSRSRAPCIAGDPHLPPLLPNLFLIAGYRSPSYHAVGFMTPGIPAVLIGRNPWIAWGGTSLHAASSDLFDASGLPASAITMRRERLRVRFAGTRELLIRETALGPIISDVLPLAGNPCALRWMGHQCTDELTAMLEVNRARNWQEFRAAIDGLGVPGQTMIYADIAGHIGKAMAAHLPARPPTGETALPLPAAAERWWSQTARSSDLPSEFDPAEGFVASANERPPAAGVVIGHLFSSSQRFQRLRDVLRQATNWGFPHLAVLQRDVLLPAALPLRDRLVGLLRRGTGTAQRRLAAQLATWDGRYTAASRGALLFELLLFHLGMALHGRRGLAADAAGWNARDLLFHDLSNLPSHILAQKLRRAIPATLRRGRWYGAWGGMHRVAPRHVLAGLPVIGRRYRVRDFATDGGSDTLLQTAHAPTGRRHRAGLVATARHISDLSDPDRNWFVLLGGQDGWAGSATSIDQIALWRVGEYVQVPLRPETARAAFPFYTKLHP
jgi:penicillin G amidase